tara:strand:- start:3052 stop:5472 length:2421 start_codon:yes stop_codon:yes gene_type:complete
MARRNSEFSGALGRLRNFEATVIGIDEPNQEIIILSGTPDEQNEIRVPATFGGVGSGGLYRYPAIGSKVLCKYVQPASSGPVQIEREIYSSNRNKGIAGVSLDANVRSGSIGYPDVKAGDAILSGDSGAALSLKGRPSNSSISLKNSMNSGIFISQKGVSTKSSIISDTIQQVSDGSRQRHGVVLRPSKYNSSGDNGQVGHRLTTNIKAGYGEVRGLFPGTKAADSSYMGQARNVPLSEYRLVINEFAETSNFMGFDDEAKKVRDKKLHKRALRHQIRSLDSRNILHLEPHQLIEVLGGNVVNYRGESLDINYNPIMIGQTNGSPPESNLTVAYEKARRLTRRGIAYHFQVSTASNTESLANDKDNFIFSVDKEGVLKVNVPRSTSSGNIPYVTNSIFYSSNGSITSSPDSDTKSTTEDLPVLLRSKKNNVIIPKVSAKSSMNEEGMPQRETGVRYSNDDSYFTGMTPVINGVRVNTTKHHNMYAAAEMLIANYITGLNIAPTTVKCSGMVHGSPIHEPFERLRDNLTGGGKDPNVVTFMSTVQVEPQPPAISPGGGVSVGGMDYTLEADRASSPINVPYTNSFSVSEGTGASAGQFSVNNIDSSGRRRLSPAGKSANINLEGSLEMSVGADAHDKKSIVLDTAGSLVAWFGKDKMGRSVVMQTDGSVMINIGGTNKGGFNPGRLDLRVNITDKGIVGDENFAPDGGPQASDYIISISENGLVIAGMTAAPMIIRNEGNLMLESVAKLILAGSSIECREGNRPPRPTYKAPVSQDTPSETGESITPEEIAEMLECLVEEAAKLTSE